MSRGEWCLLSACGRGEPFAACVGAAQVRDDEFDVAAAQRRFVAAGAIVDFQ